MKSSNSPQTLFRFASLRNPNLTETNPTNLAFIHRPPNLEGVFDGVNPSENQSKYDALLEVANNFTAILSVDDLENGQFYELLKIGKALSKSEKLSTKEKAESKTKYLALQSNANDFKSLWDNLIYQYLTQKSLYVKEAICFILKGLHIGYVQTIASTDELKKINGSDFLIVAYDAQIVLPHTIFEEVELSLPKSRSENTKLSSREHVALEVESQKESSKKTALVEKECLLELKSILKTIQQKYHKTFEKAYKEAHNLYLSKNQEQINAFEIQLEIINDLIKNNATEGEIENANAELEKLNVEPFEFKYKKELNWEDLTSKLNENQLKLFIANFTNANEVLDKSINFSTAKKSIASDGTYSLNDQLISFEYDNYFEVFEALHQRVNQLEKQVIQLSPSDAKIFAKVGGVLFLVSKNNNNITPLTYSLTLVGSDTFFGLFPYVNLILGVENESWQVSQLAISANTDLGSFNETLSNVMPQNNLISFLPFLVNKFSQHINEMTLQIYFSNGRSANIEVSTLKANETIRGTFNFTPPSTGTGTPSSTQNKHFGLKRLGVAEYMKVVQTVHAYVPGEVSNIENVMASELRHKSMTEFTHTEDTLTSSKSQEVEKISDTTKTNRAEMQTETAKEIARQQSLQSHTSSSGGIGSFSIDTSLTYATNNAQNISNRQSVAKAQEITERAMERVQLKISEERIQKIIQEVTQTNVHEFDNRNGKNHITGVYRWVDKKMKNQIFNYGKRTMFEFMIPEPAKLHRLAHEVGGGHTLTKPVDPRKDIANPMLNANFATEQLLTHWAEIYGVTLTNLPPSTKEKVFEISGSPNTNSHFEQINFSFNIDENYKAIILKNTYLINRNFNSFNAVPSTIAYYNYKGGNEYLQNYANTIAGELFTANINLENNNLFSYSGHNVKNFIFYLTFYCHLKEDFIANWKTENFNAIIQAYETALAKYNEDVANWQAEQDAKKDEAKEKVTRFYRNIESDVIKHNCMAYLLQDYLNKLGTNFTTGNLMENFSVNLSDDLDKYTALAKFLEQAFEWSIMDYTFYPYYWASRAEWQKMYLTESDDQLFRNFLQAGLARVVVTVRPGFEAAVQYFLATGQVWMGGEAPIIGDPLFMSIAQEMIEPTGKPQGKYWITRIPTTLTILQAHSTGLDVDPTQPLPIFPESDPSNCENPAELEDKSQFRTDKEVFLEASDKPSTLPKD